MMTIFRFIEIQSQQKTLCSELLRKLGSKFKQLHSRISELFE